MAALLATSSAGHEPDAYAAVIGPAVVSFTPPSAPDLGVNAIQTISCPATTWCGASGGSDGSTVSTLYTGVAGDWTATVAPLPAGAASNQSGGSVSSIDCPAVEECIAVGSYFDTTRNNPTPLIWSTTSGSAWHVAAIGTPSGGLSGLLTSVSCPTTDWCGYGGLYYTSGGEADGWLLTESDGSFTSVSAPLPSDASANPSFDIQAVSCPEEGWCMAVALYDDTSGYQEMAATQLVSGTWTDVTPAHWQLGLRSAGSLSCPSAGWCVFDGDFLDGSGYDHFGLAQFASGSWTFTDAPVASDAPSGAAIFAEIGGVSCGAVDSCVALGSYDYDSAQMIRVEAVTLSGGTWSAITTPNPPNTQQSTPGAIQCYTAGNCTATASYEYPSPDVYGGLMLSLANGAWTETAAVNYSSLGDVSCVSADWCAIAGGTLDAGPLVEFAQYGGASTAVEVASSRNPAVAGTPVTYTATVGPTPDGGVVTFFDGGSVVPGCGHQSVDPATGQAECTITYTTETTNPGTGPHDITAIYFGDSSFAESGPSPVLTENVVSPAGTYVSLTASANPVQVDQPVTYRASLSPAAEGGILAITVDGAIPADCTPSAVSPSSATLSCTMTFSGAGSHQIEAAYSGAPGYGPSDTTITQTVSSPPSCPTGISHLASGEPWAVASMTTTIEGRSCAGYWVVTRTGGVTAIGAAPWLGDMSTVHLNAAMIGIAATPDHNGYWLLGADGGIFTFGDAHFYGSTGNVHLTKPVVGMAATANGGGYWLVASDGGIFTFGDAHFYGSTGNLVINKPVVGMAPASAGAGYWVVAADGGIFSFGDAQFYGSLGQITLAAPIVGMSTQPGGRGYRLVGSDGGVFDFGDATYYGSLPADQVTDPQVTTIATSVDGNGYYLINATGHIWAFGDAPYLGNA